MEILGKLYCKVLNFVLSLQRKYFMKIAIKKKLIW